MPLGQFRGGQIFGTPVSQPMMGGPQMPQPFQGRGAGGAPGGAGMPNMPQQQPVQLHPALAEALQNINKEPWYQQQPVQDAYAGFAEGTANTAGQGTPAQMWAKIQAQNGQPGGGLLGPKGLA